MTDIVDRLNGLAHALRKDGKQMTGHEVKEAASEIERLRDERDRLREALREVGTGNECRVLAVHPPRCARAARARAALKETGHE